MKKMKIGIDIDDTITNIKEELTQALFDYAKSLGKNIDNIHEIREDANNDGKCYQELFGFSYDELKHFLKNIQENITNNAIPRENAVKIINKLKEEGNEIIIITARDSEFHDDPYKESKEWLDKHNILYDKLIVNARKKDNVCNEHNIDLFIDDKLNHCLEVSKLGINVIRVSNDNKDINDIKTYSNWIDIYNYINSLGGTI